MDYDPDDIRHRIFIEGAETEADELCLLEFVFTLCIRDGEECIEAMRFFDNEPCADRRGWIDPKLIIKVRGRS